MESFQELKKDKAPGIDGVTVRKYEEKLEENLKERIVKTKGEEIQTSSSQTGIHTEG